MSLSSHLNENDAFSKLSTSDQTILKNENFAIVEDFISPALADSLIKDIGQLMGTAEVSKSASMEYGSVSWFELLPKQPFAHIESKGRNILYSIVSSLKDTIEHAVGIELDYDITELKYAFYPSGGHYRKHLDAMNVGELSREYSFIIYLNKGWQEKDGGCLRVYDHLDSHGTRHMDIAPKSGTIVIFKSDVVPHEVLRTNSKRMAVIGWLNRRVPVPEVDESGLSSLARAILQHYREKGEAVKFGP
eukprot:CAMPEP_0113937268 /NCGR_PEP_ID=MMETSP1339-20121228/3923_1 /TAXON_ID=94617 /ORGANISM="Fibrocapsa japonica" /LENGTH=246 /DNA_ID=CAMNT_0000939967 /DNA_START=157 /DNA_END=897 /DNA_ORIENTATION=- /assembly_acc=CAM_ASM_000762